MQNSAVNEMIHLVSRKKVDVTVFDYADTVDDFSDCPTMRAFSPSALVTH